jgi:uncharacterized membrane protein YphA (DoxX/SURF4 family)
VKSLRWASGMLALLFAASAYAHVKWFVPLGGPMPADFQWYGWTDSAVLVWLAIAVCLIATSLWLDVRLPVPRIAPERILHTLEWVLRIFTGVSLLLTAHNGELIAPHYHWSNWTAQILIVLENASGLLLMTSWVFAGSLMLLLLYIGTGVLAGWQVIEYLNIAGVAVYLLCLHYPRIDVRERLQVIALPLLRVLTGCALITLGFSEKLLRPDYAETFVQTYMWNFMQTLGFTGYSDRLFVLSAGTMEVVFGIILVIGSTTRLNILVVSLFMLTSNLTFLAQGHYREALTEIIGHLPIMAIAIVYLFLGGGQRWKLSAWLRR